MPNFSVDGIVAVRDGKPYIRISKDSKILGQFSMAEARNFAHDILNMCSRSEADAIIFKFFSKHEFPDEAMAVLMQDFRNFRHDLDSESVEKTVTDPDLGIDIKGPDFTKQ